MKRIINTEYGKYSEILCYFTILYEVLGLLYIE